MIAALNCCVCNMWNATWTHTVAVAGELLPVCRKAYMRQAMISTSFKVSCYKAQGASR